MIDFAELMKTYDEAKAALDATRLALEDARRQHTDAVNRMNAAQETIDKAISEMKGAAPGGTDWAMKAVRCEEAQ